MLKGYDVSSYQGNFTFPGDTSFGIVKATEDASYINPNFVSDWASLKARNIPRIAYHFFRPSVPVLLQANHFVSSIALAGTRSWDGIAVDAEVSDGIAPHRVAESLREFRAAVEVLTGKKLIFYSDPTFIMKGYADGMYTCPLWIADPNHPAGLPVQLPHPWPKWTFHQYSSRPEDQDVFNGSDLTLALMLGKVVPVPR